MEIDLSVLRLMEREREIPFEELEKAALDQPASTFISLGLDGRSRGEIGPSSSFLSFPSLWDGHVSHARFPRAPFIFETAQTTPEGGHRVHFSI